MAVVAVLAGCSGGSSTGSPNAGPASPPQARGGLIGAIDAAKLAAACTNATDAQTALSGQLGATTVDPTLTAAAAVLAGPPADAQSAALSAQVRADVSAGREADAVAALKAFCTSHGH